MSMNFSLKWGGPNKEFFLSDGIQSDLSIISNEFFLFNNFSFEPQHHLDDPYMIVFALIYTQKL